MKSYAKLKPLITLILVVTIFILPLVSAEKINTNIPLDIQCSNSTYLNISYIKNTVTSDKLINSETNTTKSGNHYNYIINKSLNNNTGILEIGYHCDINGIDNSFGYTINISNTGQQVSLSNIIIVLVFLFVSGLFYFIGNSFEKTKWIIKSSFYMASLIAVLLAVNSGSIIASESMGLNAMSSSGLILVISIILVMFLYLFITWSINTFKNLKEAKNQRWSY